MFGRKISVTCVAIGLVLSMALASWASMSREPGPPNMGLREPGPADRGPRDPGPQQLGPREPGMPRDPELPRPEDRDPEFKRQQIQVRIDQLRAQSRAAEEQARRLQAEAADLERRLTGKSGPRGEKPPIKGKQQELSEKKLQDARKHIEELERLAREAKERGELDRARRLHEEAVQIKESYRQGFERQDFERMRGDLIRIKEAAESAARQGRRDEADELRRKAEQMGHEFDERAGLAKRQQVKAKIESLRDEAQRAEAAGDLERAKRFGQQAKELESQLKASPPKLEGEIDRDKLSRMIEQLQAEVKSLRQDMNELRRRAPL